MNKVIENMTNNVNNALSERNVDNLIKNLREKYLEIIKMTDPSDKRKESSQMWRDIAIALNADTNNQIIKYIFHKTGVDYSAAKPIIINDDRSNEIKKSIWRLMKTYEKIYFIKSFLYYGIAPSLLNEDELREKNFNLFYFMWQKEDDPNRLDIPRNLDISNENFHAYKYWNNKQINAYYFANILPKLLKECGINIDVNIPEYKELLTLPSYNFKFVINDYIRDGNVDWIKGYVKFIQTSNEKDIPEGYVNLSISYILAQLNATYKRANKISGYINKLKSVVFKKRFKWSSICGMLEKNVGLDTLRQLASYEIEPPIDNLLMKTKRELCVELSKRFEKLITDKKEAIPKCINTTSILGTELEDIPPEFFFSYTHNKFVYCDDIRELHTQLQKNNNRHPIDRTKISDKNVERINEWYDYLIKVTNSMEDEEYDDNMLISEKSQLTSKLTNLMSLLNYPNSQELFINADDSKLRKFISLLKDEQILSDNEIMNLSQYTNVNQYKMVLIDMLLLKIKNDPQQVRVEGRSDPLSSVAINLSNVYNEVFE
jgi:hypothetical protein